MNNPTEEKKILRRELREKCKQLPLEQRNLADNAINNRLMNGELWRGITKIAIYASDGSEPELKPFVQWAFNCGKKIFLPRYRCESHDYELAEMCMQPTGDHNTIYDYLSKRLKNNKNLAMLDLQENYPHTESYSAELKDDDEIAARLYELHGLAPWAWHYMSERLKKKYGIEEG